MSFIKPFHPVMIGIILFLGVALPAEQTASSPFHPPNHSLYPLEPGAEWRYRESGAGMTATSVVRVDSVNASGGFKKASVTKRYLNLPAQAVQRYEVSLRQEGIEEKMLVPQAPMTRVGFEKPTLILAGRPVLQVGHSWRSESTLGAESPIADVKGTTAIYYRVLGWEQVTVPAGTFDALKIQSSTAPFEMDGVIKVPEPERIRKTEPLPGPTTEWYAPFTGLVKLSDPEGSMELLSFNLVPDSCDFAVVRLAGAVRVNGREVGAEILSGDRLHLEVPGGGNIMLYDRDRCRQHVEGETVIDIATQCGTKPPEITSDSSPGQVITIIQGRLKANILKGVANIFSRYRQWKTGAMRAGGIRGTSFVIEAGEEIDSIEVTEGEVEVTENATGQVFIVGEGERREFRHRPPSDA